jgi:hypothetical protein
MQKKYTVQKRAITAELYFRSNCSLVLTHSLWKTFQLGNSANSANRAAWCHFLDEGSCGCISLGATGRVRESVNEHTQKHRLGDSQLNSTPPKKNVIRERTETMEREKSLQFTHSL